MQCDEASRDGSELSEGLGLYPERAEVAAVMALVWALVRSGPNFDGRQVDVQRAVAAAIDNAVAAERERWRDAIEALAHSWDDPAETYGMRLALKEGLRA